MKFLALLAAAALLQPLAAHAQPAPAAQAEVRAPVTILISIDGFRPDYLNRGVTPVLSKLAAEGATGPMRPSFPSKTFPNHWTLVTGLRPDRNGIVANKFEDPAHPGEVFTMASDEPYWWDEATPIWIDAERAGVRTGTQFWPGSNVGIGGTKKGYHVEGGARPSDWAQFNGEITAEQRVNGILDWLRRPAAIRPRFLTLYFDAVDSAGHAKGPSAPETTRAVAEVDKKIGELLAGMAALGQSANLVIVADHGMAETSDKRMVVLPPQVAKNIRIVEAGPYLAFSALPGKAKQVEKALIGRHPHMECWRKADIPARLFYGKNPRISPLLCLAESGWSISDKAPSKPFTGGNHGYDNAAPDMAALFIAHGPAFQQATLPAFDNVDVYPLLRDLIGLPAKPDIDGTDAVFATVIKR
jgi:predicted AlkP superfamily pyrophosphatase or phosphodiesterase